MIIFPLERVIKQSIPKIILSVMAIANCESEFWNRSFETELIQRRKLEQSKPAFKSGDIKCIRKTAIPSMPGRSLWTYQS